MTSNFREHLIIFEQKGLSEFTYAVVVVVELVVRLVAVVLVVVLVVVVLEVDVELVVVVVQRSDEFFTVNVTQYESDCNNSLINKEKEQRINRLRTSEVRKFLPSIGNGAQLLWS